MLIRSQDKEKIVVMNNTCNISLRDYGEGGKYFVDAVFAGRTGATLAIYSSKEKAIKVLDMIEAFYINLEFAKFNGREREGFTEQIFYMPKEDEVKV